MLFAIENANGKKKKKYVEEESDVEPDESICYKIFEGVNPSEPPKYRDYNDFFNLIEAKK